MNNAVIRHAHVVQGTSRFTSVISTEHWPNVLPAERTAHTGISVNCFTEMYDKIWAILKQLFS